MGRLLPIFIILCSCWTNPQVKDKTLKVNLNNLTLDSLINYKQNTYRLFLGQTKESLKNTVELQRNFEADINANSGDSIQHYMNIIEDLITVINFDTTEVLPALYFTFLKDKLTDFECSIVYQPQEKDKQAIYNFLTSLEPYFSKLANIDNKKKLSHKLSLQFDNSNKEEKFYIDTTGQYDMLFVYETKTK